MRWKKEPRALSKRPTADLALPVQGEPPADSQLAAGIASRLDALPRGEVNALLSQRLPQESAMPFKAMGLHPLLVRAIREMRYEEPTPIQAEAIERTILRLGHSTREITVRFTSQMDRP